MNMKSAYICGPLTELPLANQANVKAFYSAIGDLFQAATGIRAFVPHEHYDPIAHAHFMPDAVDGFERLQVCENTSLLVAIAIGPGIRPMADFFISRYFTITILTPNERRMSSASSDEYPFE